MELTTPENNNTNNISSSSSSSLSHNQEKKTIFDMYHLNNNIIIERQYINYCKTTVELSNTKTNCGSKQQRTITNETYTYTRLRRKIM